MPRREEFLSAALQRFSRVGFAATSTRDICGDVGLAHSAIYNYFPSKGAILRALEEREMFPMQRGAERVLSEHAGQPPLERLAQLLRYTIEVAIERRDGWALFQDMIRHLSRRDRITVLNAITRLCQLTHGDIAFEGASLVALRPHEIIRRGIVRTYQNMALCPPMTVLANVMLGGLWRHSSAALADWFGTPKARRRARLLEADARDAMRAVGIEDAGGSLVESLSYGMRRKVELARALCADPRLILLDEPVSGLSDSEVADLIALLQNLRNSHGLTMIVIEHHMDVVMTLSDRIVVLDGGKVIADGAPSAVAKDPAVLEAYLGEPA